jgi:hypothetical protein
MLATRGEGILEGLVGASKDDLVVCAIAVSLRVLVRLILRLW